MRIDPRAAMSATAEPEISAKNIDAPIDTCASPPRIHPKSDEANAINRREMPDAFMIAPARMNSGIASSGKLVAPLYATIARFGRMPRPWLVTIAATATMPSATAIGTLSTTSASTAPKSSSISIIAIRRRRSLRCFGERYAARARWPLRGEQIDEMHDFGDDDQRRADRNHRLHDAHRNPGQADQRVGGEDRRDPDTDATEEREEEDHENLSKDAHRAACGPGDALDELGAADMRSPDRGERRAVERDPGEQYGRDLVVPDQRPASEAKQHAERNFHGEDDHQCDDNPLEEMAVRGAEAFHRASGWSLAFISRVLPRDRSTPSPPGLPFQTPRRSACSP